MKTLAVLCLVASIVANTLAATITYDFEEDLGDLEQNPYNTVVWKQIKYSELEDDGVAAPIPRAEDGGEGVAIVDLLKQVSGGAAVNTPSLDIPDGGTVTLAYWTRSGLPEANGVQVAYLEDGKSKQKFLLNLYRAANSTNNEFLLASAEIPKGLENPIQIWIYGSLGNGTSTDVVAIDNVSISGVGGHPTTQEPTTVPADDDDCGTTSPSEEVCRDYTVTSTTTTTTTSTVTICGDAPPPSEVCPGTLFK